MNTYLHTGINVLKTIDNWCWGGEHKIANLSYWPEFRKNWQEFRKFPTFYIKTEPSAQMHATVVKEARTEWLAPRVPTLVFFFFFSFCSLIEIQSCASFWYTAKHNRFFQILFYYTSLWNTEYNSLCSGNLLFICFKYSSLYPKFLIHFSLTSFPLW